MNNDASNAQKMISTFENRNDVDYLYMTYAALEGLLLLQIIYYFHFISFLQSYWISLLINFFYKIEQVEERNSITSNQSPTQAIIHAYESNLLLGAETLLVLFVCNSSQEMRLFRMYPEILQADTTHGTNKEKKIVHFSVFWCKQ